MINGIYIYEIVLQGARALIKSEDYLNEINIYPVADKDTGTNMADTMRSVVSVSQPDESVSVALGNIADAAMNGARGGSGNIIGHLLNGLYLNCENRNAVDEPFLIEMFVKAAKHVVVILSDSMKGTIGEVIEKWGEYLEKSDKSNYKALLTSSVAVAEKTADDSAKCNDKNAVDAGAKGAAIFIKGLVDGIFSDKNFSITDYHIIKTADFDKINHSSVAKRYCVDTLIIGQNLTEKTLRDEVEMMGDNLIIKGFPEKMRVHIDSDEPWNVMEALQKHGFAASQNIRDLQREKEVASKHLRIGILTDSSNDLPQELLDKYLIEVVPLTINIGDECYVDHIGITSKRFTERLLENKCVPTTAQPCFKAFYDRYMSMTKYCDAVIAVHLSDSLSGTQKNSRRAAQTVSRETGKKIVVVDGNSATCGLGLLLVRVAEEIEKGTDFDDVIAKTKAWSGENRIFISCLTTKYLLNSGRLGSVKGSLTSFIGLKPIIYFSSERKLTKLRIDFLKKTNRRHILEYIRNFVEGKKIWNYSLAHVDNMEAMEAYTSFMRELTGREPLFVSDPSPMLVGKVGPQASAIAIALE